jgi:hypothetical protein
MVDPSAVIQNLIEYYPDALAAAIFNSSGQIEFSTSNWDISAEVQRLLQSWRSGSAQFVNVQGIKYSMLQCTPERLIATNFGKQGHLVGASTPDLAHYVVAYVNPNAEAWNHAAYPAVARAVAMMAGASSIAQAGTFVPTSGGGGGGAASQGGSPAPQKASIDPNLKAEIEGFLQWIRDPQGLQGYITYFLQANDPNVIQKLAAVYNEFRRIFNF